MWLQGVAIEPGSNREYLMFEVWSLERRIAMKRLYFDYAVAMEDKDAVSSAMRDLSQLMIPGLEQAQAAMERKNRETLDRFKNKPFVLRVDVDEEENLGFTLER